MAMVTNKNTLITRFFKTSLLNKSSHIYTNNFRFQNNNSEKKFHTDNDRTIVTILNKENDAPLMVDTFSSTGFRLNNGLAVVGSIALFPKSILNWKVKSSECITKESLALFCTLAPKLDILILGKGDKNSKYDQSIMPFLRSKGINVEILATEQAVATFNFLNDENRSVAGAFIPPSNIRYDSDDVADSIQRKRQLYEAIDKTY